MLLGVDDLMIMIVVSIVLAVLCAVITVGASRGKISANSAVGIRGSSRFLGNGVLR